MILLVQDIDAVWPIAADSLKRVLPHVHGDFDLTDLYHNIRASKNQLWLVENRGWAVTGIRKRKQKVIMTIIALTGKTIVKDLRDDANFMRYIKETYGVTQLEAFCRPSMVKLVTQYGWKPKYQVVTLDLGDS